MSIITFTSDFGSRDYYAAAIKGAILCQNPSLNIIDITHELPFFDIVQGAFIFKNVWHNFPKGTIHLISNNDFLEKDKGFIVFEKEGHFFIGPNNGLFPLIFPNQLDTVYSLNNPTRGTFQIKEVYALAIGAISKGIPLHEIGMIQQEVVERINLQPVITHSSINGSVIYVDNYENVMLNITQSLFEKVGHGRPFSLYFKRNDPIIQLSTHYNDVPIGEVLCLFNSAKHLEIAINMGRASSLLGLKVEDTIQVEFHHSQ